MLRNESLSYTVNSMANEMVMHEAGHQPWCWSTMSDKNFILPDTMAEWLNKLHVVKFDKSVWGDKIAVA